MNKIFHVLLERDEDGFWVATVPELQGVVSQGRTKKEARDNVHEAIALHLEEIGDQASDGRAILYLESIRVTA